MKHQFNRRRIITRLKLSAVMIYNRKQVTARRSIFHIVCRTAASTDLMMNIKCNIQRRHHSDIHRKLVHSNFEEKLISNHNKFDSKHISQKAKNRNYLF